MKKPEYQHELPPLPAGWIDDRVGCPKEGEYYIDPFGELEKAPYFIGALRRIIVRDPKLPAPPSQGESA